MSLLIEALADAALDTIKLIPFLFVTYLVMEYLEDKAGETSTAMLKKAGRFGSVIGAAAGVLPQCGFSASAASLYAGGVITAGTLLAVFLSTSDEMLPILISEAVPAGRILAILAMKLVLGLVTGIAVDAAVRFFHRGRTQHHIHDLCEQDHCGCDEEEGSGILRPALTHTLKVAAYIFVLTFILTLIVEGIGEDAIAGFLTGKPVAGVLLSGLVGLIPNCAASVMITELYLKGLLGAGQMIAGLLVGAGVGLLVLFRANRHLKENLQLTGLLYCSGVFWGIVLELMHVTF